MNILVKHCSSPDLPQGPTCWWHLHPGPRCEWRNLDWVKLAISSCYLFSWVKCPYSRCQFSWRDNFNLPYRNIYHIHCVIFAFYLYLFTIFPLIVAPPSFLGPQNILCLQPADSKFSFSSIKDNNLIFIWLIQH